MCALSLSEILIDLVVQGFLWLQTVVVDLRPSVNLTQMSRHILLLHISICSQCEENNRSKKISHIECIFFCKSSRLLVYYSHSKRRVFLKKTLFLIILKSFEKRRNFENESLKRAAVLPSCSRCQYLKLTVIQPDQFQIKLRPSKFI